MITIETPYIWDLKLRIVADYHEFPPLNWTHRLNGSPNWLLKIVLAGEGIIRGIEGKEVHSSRGSVFLFEPNSIHDFGSAKGNSWDTIWCHFLQKDDWNKYLQWPLVLDGIHALFIDGKSKEFIAIEDTAKKIINRIHTTSQYREEFAQNSLEELLILCSRHIPNTWSSNKDSRIIEAVNFICSDIGAYLETKKIATHCGLSVSRLSYLFKENMGLTVQAYIEFMRIERAKIRLTATGEPISSIAYALGFSHPFYFSKRFTKHVGINPRKFRNEKTLTNVERK